MNICFIMYLQVLAARAIELSMAEIVLAQVGFVKSRMYIWDGADCAATVRD